MCAFFTVSLGAAAIRFYFFTVGLGARSNIGGYDLEPLAQRGHRLLMFDERGAGRSEIISDPSKLRIEDFARDVEHFRRKFGLKQFGLIGLSWGSAVALKYMTMYPQRASRVVFLSPISPTIALWDERVKHLDSLETEREREEEKQDREKLKAAEGAEVTSACEQMFAVSHRLYVQDVGHFKNTRAKACDLPAAGVRNGLFVSKAALASLGEWDFRPEMRDVKAPALVLEGAETNVPLDATREWVKSLPNARLLLIPNAGHMNWVDQPEAVISAMDEFFRGNWPPGSAK